MPSSESPNIARFGPFQLDLQAGELHKNGRKIRLQEQTFQVLSVLVLHPGELVTREALRKKLWPNDTVVEFDNSIHAAVKKLRLALGDSAEKPRYIETVARRGYRLIVSVEPVAVQPPRSVVGSQPRTSSGSSLIGKRVSHYRVLEILGGGGMGLVYKAEDIKLGRAVALKFLPEELAGDSVALGRFEREARAASSLDHSNICSIYEFGEHEGQPFIAMQFLEGQTVSQRIRAATTQGIALTTSELLDIAMQVTSGLEVAHQKGIIHRDIKPANIFITNRGEVKILDFGLAKLVESVEVEQVSQASASGTAAMALNLTRTGAEMGTAAYMSPEQIRREKVDARTDLFSLGLVLYEMATGQQAFAGDTMLAVHDAMLHRTPTPMRQLNPGLPPGLETIINKALEKVLNLRYQSASDIRTDLGGLRQALTPAAPTAATAPSRPHVRVLGDVLTGISSGWRARMKTRRNLMLIGASAVLLAAGAKALHVSPLWWYRTNSSGLQFRVGKSPSSAAFDGANLWIASLGDGTVTKLRASDGTNLGTFSVGSKPAQIAFDGVSIWVTNHGSSNVTKLRPSDGAILGTFPAGWSPGAIAFDGANIWAVDQTSNTVVKLRTSDGAALTTYPVDPNPVAIAFDGTNLWITSDVPQGAVVELRAHDGAKLGTFPVGSYAVGVAFDGANVWVANSGSGTVSKIRASDHFTLGSFRVGIKPGGLMFDGTNIWVANSGSNNVMKLRASDGANLGTFAVGAQPVGFTFDGVHIWVVNYGSNTVSKL